MHKRVDLKGTPEAGEGALHVEATSDVIKHTSRWPPESDRWPRLTRSGCCKTVDKT